MEENFGEEPRLLRILAQVGEAFFAQGGRFGCMLSGSFNATTQSLRRHDLETIPQLFTRKLWRSLGRKKRYGSIWKHEVLVYSFVHIARSKLAAGHGLELYSIPSFRTRGCVNTRMR